jgi:Zn-dependent protease
LGLALIFGLAIRFGLVSSGALKIVGVIVVINLVLAIFNLIPIPPMDGSKILFAFLPASLIDWRAKLERYGFIFALVFVIFFWQFVSPIVEWLFGLIVG